MDEFDAFSSPATTAETTEQDPAADFLAQEKTALAGLEDDFGVGASEPVQSLDTGSGLLEVDSAPEVMATSEGIEDLGAGGETDLSAFSQEQAAPESAETYQDDSEPADSYSAISQQDTVQAEPEKLKLWREEHAKRLEEKDAAEMKDKVEWKEKAKKELDDWYKHHSEQVQKTQATNREAEDAFVQDRDEKNPAQAWEKVSRLCEFNPKHSKNTKDVSRMRSILLQMKQTPLVR
ncbi:hypothetical protein ACOMHN_022089 [Nucella lapillus]